MYEIRQFRPTLYLLVLLGMAGFGFALESPGLWLFATSLVLVNYWLVKTGRFRPMPRLLSNAVTILGIVVLASTIHEGTDTPLYIVGQFLVLLQLIKLFEQRANRDYAQILILNLLQMVAAAISTASFLYGLILIAYLFVALYCCLLFHLKVETDSVRAANWVRMQRPGGPALGLQLSTVSAARPQDDKPMVRSLRGIAAVMSAIGMSAAIFTFFFFPRNANTGLIGPLQFQPNEALTGFTDSVSFQNVAMITQNTQTIAWVKASRGGRPFQGVLLLRGLTLDKYSGRSGEKRDADYTWTRASPRDAIPLEFSVNARWREISPETGEELLHQEITLYPTGTSALFAAGGMVRFKPDVPGLFRYWREDEVLQTDGPLFRRISYEVESRDRVMANSWQFGANANSTGPQTSESRIDPQVEAFARRPQVSGADEQGSFAERRPRSSSTTALDSRIARSIETYLRQNYLYTLDLTDAKRIEGRDPLVAFLYDLKRGHCEYFAGAMTLMCQSLGMQARMVVGFRCDEYNPMFDYYNVRQSHAHAWVEVLDDQGVWEPFDPTSSNEALVTRSDTWLQKLRAVYGYLEYSWENGVIAYDQNRQGAVIMGLEQSLRSVEVRVAHALNSVSSWWEQVKENILGWVSFNILNTMIALIPLAFALPVVLFVWDRWRLSRRAHRIGLDVLPAPEQKRLARQLGFYDELLRLLERHRILRPSHLTPLEFSDSLTFLPTDAFGTIRMLTEVFYRVRYGRHELTTDEQRELDGVILQISASLGGGSPGTML